MNPAPLPPSFYARSVVEVAPDLVGCTLTYGSCATVIVETEAYHETEPACHGFIGNRPRLEVLFGPPGLAYVYRSYGIHALINAVCEGEGTGAAVLIRALEPVSGLDEMRRRRGWEHPEDLCSGPGKLSQALGITLDLNGTSFVEGPMVIGPRPPGWQDPEIAVGPRIGITRAMELPWRFCAARSRHVSRPWPPDMRRGGRYAPVGARG